MAVFAYSRVPAFNPNTSPVSVAKSATGSVYDLGDTAFNTPLNITLVATNTVTTTLVSDANGMFPDFTLLDRVQVVFKSTSGATFVLTTSTPLPGPPSTVPGPPGVADDASIAAQVNNSGSATRTALNGSYALARVAPAEFVPAYIKGDSYANGGAGVDAGTRFFDRVFSRLRTLTPSNTGVSGTRCDQILMNQVVTGWTPNSRGIVGLADVMLNDVDTSVQLPPAQTAEAFRSLLAYLTSWYAGSITDTGVQYGPNWASGSSSTASAYADIAFNGDSCFLVFAFGPTGGVATVKKSDGTTAATVTTSGYTYAFNGVVNLSGFGAGNHSVRVQVTSGTIGLLGYLIPSPTPPNVVWYKPGAILDSARSARLAATATALQPIANLFPTVISVDVDGGWDNTTMLAPDAVHLNDKGTYYAAGLVEAKLRAALTAWRQGLNQLTAPNAGNYAVTAPAYNSPGSTAPAQVTGVTATAAKQIALTWAVAQDNGATITGYQISYRLAGSGSYTLLTTVGPKVTSYTITTGLTATTSYDFIVTAVNANGAGTASAPSTATAGTTPVVYFADNFTRANNATSAGSTSTGSVPWAAVPTSTAGAITSNQLVLTASNDLVANSGVASFHISATRTATTAASSGVIFSSNGAANAAAYFFYCDGTGKYELRYRTAGTNSYTAVAGTSVSQQTAPAAGDVLEVVRNGTQIICKLNGVTIFNVTDSANTGTYAGLWSYASGTSTWSAITVDNNY